MHDATVTVAVCQVFKDLCFYGMVLLVQELLDVVELKFQICHFLLNILFPKGKKISTFRTEPTVTVLHF